MEAQIGRSLNEALNAVKLNSLMLKKSLENNELMDGLKAANDLLGELRSATLSPGDYYKVHQDATEALDHLGRYLGTAHDAQILDLEDVYGLVQYSAACLPRLYLMICVASVYMTKDAPYSDLISDLGSMVKAVQAPVRGLFLRYYMISSMNKVISRVPIQDGLAFYLGNFTEMNKLWIRVQYLGHSSQRKMREQERNELKSLIGTCLVNIGQLDLNQDTYSMVFAKISEQVQACKDPMAQEYILQTILDVFKPDLLSESLGPYLDMISQIKIPSQHLITGIIDKVSEKGGFGVIWSHVAGLKQTASDRLDTMKGMVNMSLQAGWNAREIEEIMSCVVEIQDVYLMEHQESLGELLTSPLRVQIEDSLVVPSLRVLLESSSLLVKREFAKELVTQIVKQGQHLKESRDILGLIECLFDTDQLGILADFLQYLDKTPESLKQIKEMLLKYPDSLKTLAPPLISIILHQSKSDSSLFRSCLQITQQLYKQPDSSILCIKLWLQSAQTADTLDAEEFAYDFYVQALTAYEEADVDALTQFTVLGIIMDALSGAKGFSRDNYTALADRATTFASRILNKEYRAKAYLRAVPIWWQPVAEYAYEPMRDVLKSRDCMQKASAARQGMMNLAQGAIVAYGLAKSLVDLEKAQGRPDTKSISDAIQDTKDAFESVLQEEEALLPAGVRNKSIESATPLHHAWHDFQNLINSLYELRNEADGWADLQL